MVEEYEVTSGELLVRKWKKKSTLGREGKWDYEIGEDLRPVNLDMENISESRGNPMFTRKDNSKAFQWRIRNLPYPLEVYSVTVDDDKHSITIRTSNKKYSLHDTIKNFKFLTWREQKWIWNRVQYLKPMPTTHS